MAKDLAIVLNNGSINSAVATALAAQKCRPVLLHAEVTQQPGSRVRAAYDQQVAHFKPYREHTLPMPFLSAVQADRTSATMISDPRVPAALGPQLLELLPLLSAAARYAAHVSAIGAATPGVTAVFFSSYEFLEQVQSLLPEGERALVVREGRTDAADPDAPENWPRVMTIWRANVLGSSGKGMEYFMRHLLGTHDAVRAQESPPGLRPSSFQRGALPFRSR